ncbi:MAG: YraN family protein [Microgenomates group bacterium]
MKESENQQPELKKRVLSSKQKQLHNFSLGAWGESRATQFLISKNFTILQLNVVVGGCEVDIVAFDNKNQELAFIEVKTRKNDQFGHPGQAINYKKLRNMRKVAAAYIREYTLYKQYRFDSISILPGKIEHYENITWN